MDHIGEWETRGLLGDRVGLEIPLLKKIKFSLKRGRHVASLMMIWGFTGISTHGNE